MKLSSANQAQPQCVFAQESSAFWFLPYVSACPRAKKGLAASCSLGTGALPVIARAGKKLQMCSRLGRRRMGPEKTCVHWPQPPTLCQVGREPARSHLRKGTKLASGSCTRESETLLGKPSSAAMRVCSGKQRFLLSPLGLCLPQEQGGSGLPPAPWALVISSHR